MLSETDRIQGLFRLGWAVQTHFANFDLVPGLDWEASVATAIPAVERAESVFDYYRILRRLVVKLEDGHSYVVEPEELRVAQGRPAMDIAWVERRPVVAWAAPELRGEGVRPGGVIVEVDGHPAHELMEERAAEVAASTEHSRRVLLCRELLVGPRGEHAQVMIDTGLGAVIALARDRGLSETLPSLPPVELRWLEHGIASIAINTFIPEDMAARFDGAMDAAMDARGLVLDLRRNGGGNGAHARAIAARLTDRPLQFERSRTRQTLSSFVANGWPPMVLEAEPVVQRPRPPVFLGPLAALIGPLTASAAEDFLVGLDGIGRLTLVGETTAGSTGQPLRIDLPGGGWAKICTRRCLYPDGREFVGRGIQPNIHVPPTIVGLRAGRDEALEASAAWIASR